MLRADFIYEAPDSVESAFQFVLTRENVALLAGGTDLLPLIKYGVKKPSCLVDLRKIPTLKSITLREKSLFIGSMVTITDLSRDSLINRSIPTLGQSARSVASPQIRNCATLGGNLLQERRCLYFNQSAFWRKNISPCFKLGGIVCHQIPSSKTCRAIYYSDTAPVLLSFDAEAEFYTQNGFQIASLRDLIRHHGTQGQEKFLLTGILIPHPQEGTRAKFLKWALRQSIDFPTLNGAIRVSPLPPENSKDPSIKIVIGALGPEPISMEETTAFLVSNFSRLPSVIKETKERGLRELNTKSSLIRETGLSLKSKQNLFHLIFRALDELLGLSQSA
jgi:CO/xanthine dehydrogenase FAD-binding subunit